MVNISKHSIRGRAWPGLRRRNGGLRARLFGAVERLSDALSIGSGGIFGPGMVIGGFLGAASGAGL
jgi:hypothetical protein